MNRGREVLFVMIGPGLESQGASHHCRPARSHSMITHGVWGLSQWREVQGKPVKSLGHSNTWEELSRSRKWDWEVVSSETSGRLQLPPSFPALFPLLPLRKDPTKMSKQAALSRVIWSAMVRPVKPGRRLANSTILIMHLVASSLNLSQRPKSSRTRWSALEF